MTAASIAFLGAEVGQVALLWNQRQSDASLYWYGRLVHSMRGLAQRWEGRRADSIASCIALGIIDSPLLGSVHPSAWGPRERLLSVVPRTHEQSIEMVLAIEGAEGVTGHLPRGKKRSAAESELPADTDSRAPSRPKTKGVSFEEEAVTAPEPPILPEANEPVEAGDVPPIPGPTADKPVVEIIKRSGVPEDKSALVNLPARTHMVWSAVEKGMVRVRAKAKQHLPRPRASWFGHITDLGAFARGQSPRWGSKMRHQVVSSQVLMVSLLPLFMFLTQLWLDSFGAGSVARRAPRAPVPALG